MKWPGVISNIPTLRKTWRRAISQRLPLFNDNASPARAAPAMEISVSIPVNALKEDELLHYAALEPGAAAELARRITEQGLDPSAAAEELREEIRRLEDQLDEESRDSDELRDNAEDACRWIRRALDPDDRELSVEQLLKEALDCLE